MVKILSRRAGDVGGGVEEKSGEGLLVQKRQGNGIDR